MSKRALFTSATLSLCLLVTSAANAWVFGNSVTIKQVIQWEENSHVMVTFSNDVSCYLASADKPLLSLVLLLYATDGRADVVCHDLAENVNGYTNIHKVHRINAAK